MDNVKQWSKGRRRRAGIHYAETVGMKIYREKESIPSSLKPYIYVSYGPVFWAPFLNADWEEIESKDGVSSLMNDMPPSSLPDLALVRANKAGIGYPKI